MGYYDPVELKPHHRQAVRLRLQGYSHEEIGYLLGMHQKSVTRLLNSKKARELMKEYEREINVAFKEGIKKTFSQQLSIVQKELAKGNMRLAGKLLEAPLDVFWTKKHNRRKRRTAEDVIAELMAARQRQRELLRYSAEDLVQELIEHS